MIKCILCVQSKFFFSMYINWVGKNQQQQKNYELNLILARTFFRVCLLCLSGSVLPIFIFNRQILFHKTFFFHFRINFYVFDNAFIFIREKFYFHFNLRVFIQNPKKKRFFCETWTKQTTIKKINIIIINNSNSLLFLFQFFAH